VKPFALAKRRLASVLTEAERALLARAMASDLLALLARCTKVTGVLCVTREPQVAALAHAHGAAVLGEEQPGLSNAVEQAARHLTALGHAAMLVLPTDVPLATSAEVDTVIAKHGWAPAATLVSDEDGYGTNALAVSPPTLMPFRFGRHSFIAHRDGALSRGARVQVIRAPGLALDVDTPDDIRRLLTCDRASATSALLCECDVAARLQPRPTVSVGGQWNL
jgi:2-phospho-L-lactate guanylyltransferase